MFFLKSLKKFHFSNGTHTKYGHIIPQEEIEIENLKDFFYKCNFTEEKLEKFLRADPEISLKTVSDKEQDEKIAELKKLKSEQPDKERAIKKEIEEVNKEIKEAQKTETKEDDKKAEKKVNDIMKRAEGVRKNIKKIENLKKEVGENG